MKMTLSLFSQHVVNKYKLDQHATNVFVFLELRWEIYGLLQAGILTNKQLQVKLAPSGYYEVAHIPGLWRYVTRLVQFTLVIDSFGVKYVGRENAEHLIDSIKKSDYKMAKDWTGSLYCGITLDWHYEEGYVDISMPGYIKEYSLDSSMWCQNHHKTLPTTDHTKHIVQVPSIQ